LPFSKINFEKDMKKKLTIIIPFINYNEALLAKDSLDTLLLQPGINNCKIILSYNGTERKIKETFKLKKNLKNIKYLKTPKYFNMPQHFEYLRLKVDTKYLIILSSRRILKFGAIVELIKIMDNNLNCQACCSSYQNWEDDLNILFSHKIIGEEGPVSTKKIIKKFINGSYNSRYDFWSYMPTSLNGIVRTNFLKKISNLYSSNFYEPISPDIAAAFKLLFNTPKIYRIKKPLFIVTNRELSNGYNSIRSFNIDYYNSLKLKKIYNYLSDDLKYLAFPSLTEDFNHQRKLYYYFNKKKKIKKFYKISNFFLEQSILELFIKILNNIPSKKNVKIFYKTFKYLFKTNLNFFSCLKYFLIAILYTLFIQSPHLIKKLFVFFRGNYKYYRNKYEAAGFYVGERNYK
jgi:hypothetical protein